MKKTKKTGRTAIKVGAGLAAAGVAAAVGYYFYGSKKAKSHRKAAVQFAVDVKREAIKEAKRFEKANPEMKRTVRKLVSRVKKVAKKTEKRAR